MMSKESTKQENKLLLELATEQPEKLFLTEAGTILQDYIYAYTSQFDMSETKFSNSFVANLLFAVVERVNKNTKTIN
jgi:hypothetical protein